MPMEDQVAYLRSLGLSAIALHDEQSEERLKEVEKGAFTYLFASPERGGCTGYQGLTLWFPFSSDSAYDSVASLSESLSFPRFVIGLVLLLGLATPTT